MACLEAHQGQGPWTPTCFRLTLSSIGNSKIPNSAKAISEDKAQGHGLHVYLATDSPDNGSSRLDMETAQDRAAAHGG